MTEHVAVQLVHAVTAIRAPVTRVTQIAGVFAHVNGQVVLPFGNITTLGTHVLLGIRVG